MAAGCVQDACRRAGDACGMRKHPGDACGMPAGDACGMPAACLRPAGMLQAFCRACLRVAQACSQASKMERMHDCLLNRRHSRGPRASIIAGIQAFCSFCWPGLAKRMPAGACLRNPQAFPAGCLKHACRPQACRRHAAGIPQASRRHPLDACASRRHPLQACCRVCLRLLVCC